MIKNIKYSNPYKTIGEIAKELNLIDNKTGRPQTHTIRYWESQFKQINPTVTIKGVKKILDKPELGAIDPNIDLGVYKSNLKTKENIQKKIKKIVKIIKELKKD